jgi:hypothetical protein
VKLTECLCEKIVDVNKKYNENSNNNNNIEKIEIFLDSNS